MKRVLIFEDDVRLATFWRDGIEDAGHAAFLCADIQTALEIIDQESIEILISDILIRGEQNQFIPEGGLSLISKIRLKNLPIRIIAVSGASPSLQLDTLLANFNIERMFCKPVDVLDLIHEIENIDTADSSSTHLN